MLSLPAPGGPGFLGLWPHPFQLCPLTWPSHAVSQIWGCGRNTHTLGFSQHGDWMPVGGPGVGKTRAGRGREGENWGGRLSYDPLEAVSITPTTFCWSKKCPMSTRGQGASTDPAHLSVQERQRHFQRTGVRGDILCCSCLGSYSLASSHCSPDPCCLSLSLHLSISPALSLSLCLLVLGACPHFLPMDFLSASALAALSLARAM